MKRLVAVVARWALALVAAACTRRRRRHGRAGHRRRPRPTALRTGRRSAVAARTPSTSRSSCLRLGPDRPVRLTTVPSRRSPTARRRRSRPATCLLSRERADAWLAQPSAWPTRPRRAVCLDVTVRRRQPRDRRSSRPVDDRGLAVALTPDDPAGVTTGARRIALPARRADLRPDRAHRQRPDRLRDRAHGRRHASTAGARWWRCRSSRRSRPTPRSTSRPAGYGMLVDGTMPGTYDVGAADPSVLDIRFDAGPRRRRSAGTTSSSADHPAILREYTRSPAGRRCRPTTSSGTGGAGTSSSRARPVEVRGRELNAEHRRQAASVRRARPARAGRLPPRPAVGDGPRGLRAARVRHRALPRPRGDAAPPPGPGQPPLGVDLQLGASASGAGGPAPGLPRPGSDRAIDFTNPDAAALVPGRPDRVPGDARGQPGRRLLHRPGRRARRARRTDADVYADGRRGDEVHNAYPVLMQENVRQVLDEVRPDDGYAIARAAYTGTQGLVATWGGDTHSRDGFQLPEVPATGPSTDLGPAQRAGQHPAGGVPGPPVLGLGHRRLLRVLRPRGVRPLDPGRRAEPADALPRQGLGPPVGHADRAPRTTPR